MSEYTAQELNELAMKIILHAGDCRTLVNEAFQAAKQDKGWDEIQKKLKDARKKITEAHRLQTKVLQDTVMNDQPTLTMLFIHAQDTLMTINSELFLAENTLELICTK
ncbi:PTS lactose/cellobiose transporter subunit IIA [Merdibacter massiliensis]|uniref:PTS lactose/cellobiose transporter subunit IIA n=1 Tax=Merdibacter massiliensis TaxID=1871030 RepID=UPI00096A582E|nr:PTS lactose/cellobiose transporter subunit IIA [Merdibacter massiliensis]